MQGELHCEHKPILQHMNTDFHNAMVQAPLNPKATLLNSSRRKLPVQPLWVSDLPVILLS